METTVRGALKLEKDLSEAVERGDGQRVASVLSVIASERNGKRALSRERDAEGEGKWTLLMRAARKGHSEICTQLIIAGAPVDDNVGGVTALMAASMASSPESAADVASVLLAAGADPNIGDRYRETPLIKAAGRGLTGLVHVLITGNADVNVRDNNKHTALYYAAKGAHVDTVGCLLEAGADEEARAEALDVADEKELSSIIAVLAAPEDDSGDPLPLPLPLKDVFKTKVLAELPSGDARVGFPSNVSLLLSGVGQNYYSSSLVAGGFGIAQVIIAGDKELQNGGVRFAPQRQAIMEGMKRLALREWADGSVPLATSMVSALGAACNAVRQIHIMWATSMLARLRHDPHVEGDVDHNGSMTAEAIATIRTTTRCVDEIERQAKSVAALAATKMSADPAPPSDLIRPRACVR